ncbi:MAG: type II toxin-antitoxin system VapC family toxin [Candidatus Coatesbacteria bacterium]
MIVDTSALSALVDGDAAAGKLLAGSERHHLPVIVIGEYRFGLLRSRHRAKLEAILHDLETQWDVLAIDAGTAKAYATIRDRLRTRGQPIPENDVWIGALAVQHSLPLMSRDRHFDQIENVRRLEW